jgi:hypothetical protein
LARTDSRDHVKRSRTENHGVGDDVAGNEFDDVGEDAGGLQARPIRPSRG